MARSAGAYAGTIRRRTDIWILERDQLEGCIRRTWHFLSAFHVASTENFTIRHLADIARLAAGIATILTLSGCSSVLDALPDGGDKAPKAASVSLDVKRIGAETKLPRPWEIAGPIEADPVTVAPWIICLRSKAPEPARQTYALFYRSGKLETYRFSAIVDRCDEQSFRPF